MDEFDIMRDEETEDTAVQNEPKTNEIWNDQNLLVVDLRGYKFDGRCVKTNEAKDGEVFEIDCYNEPNFLLKLALSHGHVLASRMSGTLFIHAALNSIFKSRRKKHGVIGYASMYLGVLGSILLVPLYVVLMLNCAALSATNWMIPAMWTLAGLGIFGMIYLAIFYGPFWIL